MLAIFVFRSSDSGYGTDQVNRFTVSYRPCEIDNMKETAMRRFVTLLLLCGICFGAFAQNVPSKIDWRMVPGRYRIRDVVGASAPTYLSGPLGVYVLNKGVLARFDAKTLRQQALLELYGRQDDLPGEVLDTNRPGR